MGQGSEGGPVIQARVRGRFEAQGLVMGKVESNWTGLNDRRHDHMIGWPSGSFFRLGRPNYLSCTNLML